MDESPETRVDAALQLADLAGMGVVEMSSVRLFNELIIDQNFPDRGSAIMEMDSLARMGKDVSSIARLGKACPEDTLTCQPTFNPVYCKKTIAIWMEWMY